MNPAITYVTRPGEERRFHQYLRDDITVVLDRIFRRDQHVCIYPAYDGCADDVTLFINRWANDHIRHLRCQFLCEPYQDRDGRDLLKLFRIHDVPKGYRIKSEPFETYCRDIRKLKALPGHYIRVPLEDPRLFNMFRMSAEAWHSQYESPSISYHFEEDYQENAYSVKVSRSFDKDLLKPESPCKFTPFEYDPNR